MNTEVGPGAVAVIAVVVILVVGIMAWRIFGSHSSGEAQQQKQQGIYQDYQRRMGGPPGGPPGAPPGR